MSVYDYGVIERGHSYEYINIFLPLSDVFGKENITVFDFLLEYRNNGKEAMNRKLKALVSELKPDLALFCLFENEFDEDTIQSLAKTTTTVAYFFDDPWRRAYVAHWRTKFDFYTTPDYYMLQRYLNNGIGNVIYSPFGYNTNVYSRLNLPARYDVSFVGGYSSLRGWIVESLKKQGINVAVFGRGWGTGAKFVSQQEVVEIFNSSKINLNLSNGISYDFGYLLSCLKSPSAMKHILLNRKNKEQVKGRHYEINACGGFQLSYFVPGLNMVYEIDKELAVFEDPRQLPDLIGMFLENDTLRKEIADAGYRKSVAMHSAQKYLQHTVSEALRRKNA